jgi:hypothetical protein
LCRGPPNLSRERARLSHRPVNLSGSSPKFGHPWGKLPHRPDRLWRQRDRFPGEREKRRRRRDKLSRCCDRGWHRSGRGRRASHRLHRHSDRFSRSPVKFRRRCLKFRGRFPKFGECCRGFWGVVANARRVAGNPRAVSIKPVDDPQTGVLLPKIAPTAAAVYQRWAPLSAVSTRHFLLFMRTVQKNTLGCDAIRPPPSPLLRRAGMCPGVGRARAAP